MYVHNGAGSRLKLRDHRTALDLLSDLQFVEAQNYLLHTLPTVVKGIPLRDAANLGAWFNELSLAQQAQVVEFYQKELLDANGLELTWYEGHGQEEGQYRFELALHRPVTSR